MAKNKYKSKLLQKPKGSTSAPSSGASSPKAHINRPVASDFRGDLSANEAKATDLAEPSVVPVVQHPPTESSLSTAATADEAPGAQLKHSAASTNKVLAQSTLGSAAAGAPADSTPANGLAEIAATIETTTCVHSTEPAAETTSAEVPEAPAAATTSTAVPAALKVAGADAGSSSEHSNADSAPPAAAAAFSWPGHYMDMLVRSYAQTVYYAAGATVGLLTGMLNQLPSSVKSL